MGYSIESCGALCQGTLPGWNVATPGRADFSE